ncbi:MAG: ferritin family protein [Candidatus Pacearchaeota archaeon]
MDHTKIKNSLKNLRRALKDEIKQEHLYTKAAEVAKSDNLSSAAEFFRNAAKDEKRHANEIEILLKSLI